MAIKPVNDGDAAKNDARQAAIRMIFAYQELFGREGSRNALQHMVFQDLCARARLTKPIFVKDELGQLDPLRAAIAEGMRLFMLDVIQVLEKDPNEPGPQVTVKK